MACIQHTLQHRNCHFSFSLCPRSRTFSAGEQMLPVGICSSTDSHVDNTQLPIRARSVKTVPIRIVSVGKNRKDGVDAITESYLVKIRRYCKVEDVQIRSNPSNTRWKLRLKRFYGLSLRKIGCCLEQLSTPSNSSLQPLSKC